MPLLDVAGYRMRYEIEGPQDGVPLVFVNGLTQAAHLWGAYVPRFAGKGFRVLTFDMLGQGESDKPVLLFDFDRQARAMASLIGELGLERPFVAGISFGGAVALRYAILFPRGLRGLLAMGAFSELDGRLKWIGENLYTGLAGVGTEYLQNWFMAFNFSSAWLEENAAAIPEMKRRGYALNDQYALQNLMEAVATCPPFSHELPEIRVPALIINGEFDYITHRGLHDILRAGIARSRLVIVQHACHAFTLEYPEVTIRLIGDFMDKVLEGTWPGDQTTWAANEDPNADPLYLPIIGDPLRAIQVAKAPAARRKPGRPAESTNSTLDYPGETMRLIGDFMDKVTSGTWPGYQNPWAAGETPEARRKPGRAAGSTGTVKKKAGRPRKKGERS
jgi:pimeloyl-ACP methyl ester carboxylesterase